MTGFITEDLRGEREARLEAERHERQERIEAEVANFCSEENLRAIVEEARTEAATVYLEEGSVLDISLYKPIVTQAVFERSRCKEALLETMQAAEPETTGVVFEHNSFPKESDQAFYIRVVFRSRLT